MSLLVDHQINQRLQPPHPLATNVPPDDFTGPASRIQAASLDLTVGAIFIPGTDSDKPGGANAPRSDYALNTGETAVIRTQETLNLGADLAGMVSRLRACLLAGC
jgi:hypothetical protein